MDGRHAILLMKFSVFINKSASMGTGGAIFSRRGETMLIESCTFSFNSVSVVGGVIHVFYSETIIIDNCTFTNNSASVDVGRGGVIHSYIWVRQCSLKVAPFLIIQLLQ